MASDVGTPPRPAEAKFVIDACLLLELKFSHAGEGGLIDSDVIGSRRSCLLRFWVGDDGKELQRLRDFFELGGGAP